MELGPPGQVGTGVKAGLPEMREGLGAEAGLQDGGGMEWKGAVLGLYKGPWKPSLPAPRLLSSVTVFASSSLANR